MVHNSGGITGSPPSGHLGPKKPSFFYKNWSFLRRYHINFSRTLAGVLRNPNHIFTKFFHDCDFSSNPGLIEGPSNREFGRVLRKMFYDYIGIPETIQAWAINKVARLAALPYSISDEEYDAIRQELKDIPRDHLMIKIYVKYSGKRITLDVGFDYFAS